MKSLNIILRSIALLFYYIERIIPRKNNRWLFGGATGFNSNSKYLFLDIVENHPEIEAIWIGRNKKVIKEVRQIGHVAYYRFSLKGIWLCLTSKYYIVDHTHGCINFWTSGGAIIVNLWHGVGWKACLWTDPKHHIYKNKGFWENYVHRLFYPSLYYHPNLLLSTSPYMTRHFFAPMFDVSYDKCVEDFYPRCYYLMQPKEKLIEKLKTNKERDTLILLETFQKFDKIIYYSPTYRDAQYDFLKESGIDFDNLNNIMVENNYLFVIKCHPSTKMGDTKSIMHSNIIILDKYTDSYNVMPFTDVMISDYSSIIFDYMLLKKPIILFPFDMEKYNNSSRSLAFNYTEIVKGIPIVNTYQDLKSQIINLSSYQFNDINMIWEKTGNLIDAIKSITKC